MNFVKQSFLCSPDFYLYFRTAFMSRIIFHKMLVASLLNSYLCQPDCHTQCRGRGKIFNIIWWWSYCYKIQNLHLQRCYFLRNLHLFKSIWHEKHKTNHECQFLLGDIRIKEKSAFLLFRDKSGHVTRYQWRKRQLFLSPQVDVHELSLPSC